MAIERMRLGVMRRQDERGGEEAFMSSHRRRGRGMN